GIRKRAGEVNRETLAWVAADRRHPFFAFLNYLDVHFGYGGPPGYPKPAWDHGSTIDEYDAGVKYTDEAIGQLLDGLKGLGVLANTIVVITSDHGESLGDHGLSFHGAALYWELVHVPLVISCPARIPAGIRVAQPVANAQLAKTVLDLAGARQDSFPGISLASAWKANQRGAANWPPVVSELPETNTIVPADLGMQGKIPIARDGWMQSVITPEWQWIVHEKLGNQLYRWNLDPGETRDLSATPEGRAAIKDLERELSNRYQNAAASSDSSNRFARSAEIP
ncbi:MAG: sulfatase-like hydrolase/transferase, partial [Acidobacteria bacterium]|nr:sulfatase-like hydrolase/transferase [Acidobacteriota bacterium]